jgi:oligopeptide/dipeptide ABC transporter ATP-binding protein
MTALIEAEGVGRDFAARGLFRRTDVLRAVRGVDLALARGEAVGLVGESGSGKSTLGRLLLGLLRPSAGRVRFDGTDLATLGRRQMRALRRRMQIVFQDPQASLDPRRRIGAQIADGLAIHGLLPRAARQARVAALLAEVGLAPPDAARFPHEFSGGQRQRIGIARAIATDPDLLVADEPVSALDVSVQAQVLRLFAGLRAQRGLALLFISHDLAVVRSLCERVVVLYLGRIMEQGPAAEIFARPAHPYTRALLAATPLLGAPRRGGRPPLAAVPHGPAAPAAGCAFCPRCPHALPACAADAPELRTLAPGWRSACLRDDLA